jgi:hypothetical protein
LLSSLKVANIWELLPSDHKTNIRLVAVLPVASRPDTEITISNIKHHEERRPLQLNNA